MKIAVFRVMTNGLRSPATLAALNRIIDALEFDLGRDHLGQFHELIAWLGPDGNAGRSQALRLAPHWFLRLAPHWLRMAAL